MTAHEMLLLRFACVVLAILERDEDWNADTIDDIGKAASDIGLSTVDSQGLFKRLLPKGIQHNGNN